MAAQPGEFARKLQLKPGMSVLVLDAPDGFAAALQDGFDGVVAQSGSGPFDVVQLFAVDSEALKRRLAAAENALKPGGVLWVAYPKKSSGVKTDLTRDVGWEGVAAAGWQAVRQIAFDDTWSSLRFKKVESAEIRGDVDAQYSGAKAPLRPIYDRIVALAYSFGDDIVLLVRKDYVALSRANHFAAVGPATRSRVDLSLKLKGEPFEGRLRPHSGLGGGAFTHTIALASVDEIDSEVEAALRRAYNRVG